MIIVGFVAGISLFLFTLSDVDDEELRPSPPIAFHYCEDANDCVPVGCDCDCSGCGFSYEDIINKDTVDDWYALEGCQPADACPEVCCRGETTVCEDNVCKVKLASCGDGKCEGFDTVENCPEDCSVESECQSTDDCKLAYHCCGFPVDCINKDIEEATELCDCAQPPFANVFDNQYAYCECDKGSCEMKTDTEAACAAVCELFKAEDCLWQDDIDGTLAEDFWAENCADYSCECFDELKECVEYNNLTICYSTSAQRCSDSSECLQYSMECVLENIEITCRVPGCDTRLPINEPTATDILGTCTDMPGFYESGGPIYAVKNGTLYYHYLAVDTFQ
jgi:hypothetical protein